MCIEDAPSKVLCNDAKSVGRAFQVLEELVVLASFALESLLSRHEIFDLWCADGALVFVNEAAQMESMLT